jgi:hypothetical protein
MPCICSYLKSVLRYKVLVLYTYHQDTTYLSKDVRIRGHLSKPKGVCEQNRLGNNTLENMEAKLHAFVNRYWREGSRDSSVARLTSSIPSNGNASIVPQSVELALGSTQTPIGTECYFLGV